jgi:hypothetical protein
LVNRFVLFEPRLMVRSQQLVLGSGGALRAGSPQRERVMDDPEAAAGNQHQLLACTDIMFDNAPESLLALG